MRGEGCWLALVGCGHLAQAAWKADHVLISQSSLRSVVCATALSSHETAAKKRTWQCSEAWK